MESKTVFIVSWSTSSFDDFDGIFTTLELAIGHVIKNGRPYGFDASNAEQAICEWKLNTAISTN